MFSLAENFSMPPVTVVIGGFNESIIKGGISG